MINLNFKYLLLLFLFHVSLACTNSSKTHIENEITGKVIKIKDGDTIDILFDDKQLTIRLAHVDCPEKRQPFGSAAKKFTSEKCFGQIVTILNEKKFDRFRRLIGVVINDKGENVNKELIRVGLAWHFKKYSADLDYARLEDSARLNRIGLWADNNPIAPWEWR